MNIEQANKLSLSSILEKVGAIAVKQKGADIWYNSPLRAEKTASFHIHIGKNIWYDFGEAKGGGVIDFVCAYLQAHGECHTVVDGLRWLSNMAQPLQNRYAVVADEVANNYTATLQKQKVTSLQNTGLLSYIQARGIPVPIAKRHLREVHVRNANSGKKFFALGMRNENEGYELRNKFFKGCLAHKGITFIRGSKIAPPEVNVFEGKFDFLSALAQRNTTSFEGDTIILNSLSCLSQALPYIKNYTYTTVNSWLDNDNAGERAADILEDFTREQGNLSFKAMNAIYAPHKDVNAWHMHKLGLRLI